MQNTIRLEHPEGKGECDIVRNVFEPAPEPHCLTTTLPTSRPVSIRETLCNEF